MISIANQPGLQHRPGRAAMSTHSAGSLELPATLSSASAQAIAEAIARNALWARDRITWRSAQLHPSIAPGSIVTLPQHTGHWRVEEWEWRASGIELTLAQAPPNSLTKHTETHADSGRINAPIDKPPPPSALQAYELPWDGQNPSDTPPLYAAVSASEKHWSGAALFIDHGNGELVPLRSSGRTRAVLGQALTPLPPASPLLIDRTHSVTISLINPDADLESANLENLAIGSNRALLGAEIIQFSRALALGGGIWCAASAEPNMQSARITLAKALFFLMQLP